MEGKIINKSVVPNKFYLCEEDVGGKSLIFTTCAINDGVDVSLLTGYLDIVRSDETTDRLLLTKTIGDNELYFSTPILNSLTMVSGFVDAQITFENADKTIVYKTKKFLIEVEKSIDGYSSFESTLPSVVVTVRDEVKNSYDECKEIETYVKETKTHLDDVKSHIDNVKTQIDYTSEHILDSAVLSVNGKSGNVVLDYEDIGEILQEKLSTVNGKSILSGENIEIEKIEVDSELNSQSENPVQNKVVTEAINSSHVVNVTQMSTIYDNESELPSLGTSGNGARYLVKSNGALPLFYYSYNASQDLWKKGYQIKGSTLYLNLEDGSLYRYTNNTNTLPYSNFIKITLSPEVIENKIGDIELALDGIIEIQNSLIGGSN